MTPPDSRLTCLWELLKAGHLEEAERLCQQYLSETPCDPEVFHISGIVAYRLQHFSQAADLIAAAIRERPENGTYYNSLGQVCQAVGNTEQALWCFENAIRLKPDFAEAHVNRGNIERHQGRVDDAIASYETALRYQPTFAMGHYELALALNEIGRTDQAIIQFYSTVQALPDFATAWIKLSEVLCRSNRLEEADEANSHALALSPRSIEALNVAAIVSLKLGDPDKAERHWRLAMAESPRSIQALSNLGQLCVESSRIGEAIDLLQRALDIDPRFAAAWNNLGIAFTIQGHVERADECFQKAVQLQPKASCALSSLIFNTYYRSDLTENRMADYCNLWNERFGRHRQRIFHGRGTNGPLRIGFVSNGFRRHSVGQLLIRTFESLREHEVEVFAYYDNVIKDDFTARFRTAANIWHDIGGRAQADVVEQMRRDSLDVLIDLDGHTAGENLGIFALGAAPVQATWLGNVGPLGVSAVDYCIVDKWLTPPPSSTATSEPLLALDHAWATFEPPENASLSEEPPLSRAGTVTFGCLNNPAKISPEVVSLWCDILHQVKDSRLLLKYAGLDDVSTAAHFRNQFTSKGIAGDRVMFEGSSPFDVMLATYREKIDIALDPVPFNGGLTTLLATWMGVPVVTFPGKHVCGRQSYSILNTIGIKESLAVSASGYVETTRALASDIGRLRRLRAQLRPAMQESALCDGNIVAEDLLKALRSVVSK